MVRRQKGEVLVLLGKQARTKQVGTENPDPEAALSLVRKGQAVCLASDLLGERIWIVADQEDADVLQSQEPGAPCYDLAEVEILAALRDPAIVRQVHEFKRAFPGGRFSRSGGRGET